MAASSSRLLLPLGVAALTLVGVGRAEAISGVCPDGSIFIVREARDIPCKAAKRVDPNDIPPLAPEFLPRPYGWEAFHRESDPNNPYNLVEVEPQQPVLPPKGEAPGVSAPSTPAPPQPAPTPRVAAAPPALPQQPAAPLVLSAREIEDLVAIVEVLQDRAPATLVQRDADHASTLQVRFARSRAFETRLARDLAARALAPAGPVVVFHVRADAPGAFWGNLTFVQGHVAFSPNAADPAEFGVVDGALGPLAAGERVVGYAVLPAGADPGQPLDVYWNDRRLTAVLTP
ncbi:MAG: hypothetical protein ACQGVC_21230 [Myxococcota bacterium]